MNEDILLIQEAYRQITEDDDIDLDQLIKDMGATLDAPGDSRDSGSVPFNNGFHFDWWKDEKEEIQGFLLDDKGEKVSFGGTNMAVATNAKELIDIAGLTPNGIRAGRAGDFKALAAETMKHYMKKRTALNKSRTDVELSAMFDLDEEHIVRIRFDGHDSELNFSQDYSKIKKWDAIVVWPEFNLKFFVKGDVDFEHGEEQTWDHPGDPGGLYFPSEVSDIKPMSPAERQQHGIQWDEHEWAVHKRYKGALGRMPVKKRMRVLSDIMTKKLEQYIMDRAEMEHEEYDPY